MYVLRGVLQTPPFLVLTREIMPDFCQSTATIHSELDWL